ncbi:MAG: endonuclease YncB(thermonuclease family) [Verrucomicrobiales bacterium]|jgi:endonuclease YncB( thermonuclease family)
MRRKQKNRLMTILIVLALGGLSMLGKKLGWIDESGDFQSPSISLPGSGSPGEKESLGSYDLLHGCSLVSDRNNDGDSFVIQHGNKKHTIRLYFVDCPEKRRHQHNGERIHEQAQYFKISDNEAIETGIAAKEFTLRLLTSGRFDVATKWERVYGSERFYGFVILDAQGGKNSGPTYLSESLVANGLGRIHTKGADLPTGGKWRKFKDHLKNVESSARSAGKGGWK